MDAYGVVSPTLNRTHVTPYSKSRQRLTTAFGLARTRSVCGRPSSQYYVHVNVDVFVAPRRLSACHSSCGSFTARKRMPLHVRVALVLCLADRTKPNVVIGVFALAEGKDVPTLDSVCHTPTL